MEKESRIAYVQSRNEERTRLVKEFSSFVNDSFVMMKEEVNRVASEYPEDPKLPAIAEKIDRTLDYFKNMGEFIESREVEIENLVELVEKQINELKSLNLFKVQLHHPGPGFFEDVSIHVQRELYRILQELFSNIIKHAEAETIIVSLAWKKGLVYLDVTDDGKGFDTNESRIMNGQGINNIRLRMDRLGGKVDVVSAPGNGTTIKLRVPFKGLANGDSGS
ncbi:MAG: hypothetical protein KI790_13655 [Cyclobacteriaceae bacterium]|nr:hypothetical protein [Cyclobacteriaceae bacterium HetDA_MAG_MS6]